MEIKGTHVSRLEGQLKEWKTKTQKAELRLKQGLALKDAHINRLEAQIKAWQKL